MTAKDYVAIAAALQKTKPTAPQMSIWDPDALEDLIVQWEKDVVAIADVLAADNPRFKRQVFYTACER